MAYGMTGHAGFWEQDSYGTSQVGSSGFLPIITESINESIPPIVQEGMKGRFEEGESFEGFHEITGDMVSECHPVMLGRALKAWFGQDSPSAIASDYWTHTFKPRTSDFDDLAAVPPHTIEIYRDAGSAFLYSDMLCNALTIEIAHGALLKMTTGWVGGGFAKSAKQTVSSGDYYAGSEYTWDQCSISFGGSAIDEVSALTLAFNNSLEAKGTLDGTKFANRIKRNGYRTLEISGTLLFTSQTEADNFRNQTEQRVVITTTQASDQMEIVLPAMRYTEFPVAIGGPGLIEVGFTAAAKYHEGSGTMIDITLINTHGAY
jgi:hypothetical protein